MSWETSWQIQKIVSLAIIGWLIFLHGYMAYSGLRKRDVTVYGKATALRKGGVYLTGRDAYVWGIISLILTFVFVGLEIYIWYAWKNWYLNLPSWAK